MRTGGNIHANRRKKKVPCFYGFYIDGRFMSSYPDGKASFMKIDVLR